MAARSAKELIDAIRQQRLQHGKQTSIASELQSSLDIISKTIYDESTHFLFELLQNADDNTYTDGSKPVLNLDYSPGRLRVDCNELGFSDADVQAICSVGQSTKKMNKGGTRPIGEKGIGFKSVFRVADIIWISSGRFSFKFDKRQELGMVTPIWEEFPEKTMDGFTSLVMQISDDYDETELLRHLTALEPTLLLFLRQITEINVRVERQEAPIWSLKLSREDAHVQGGTMTHLTRGDISTSYWMHRRLVIQSLQELNRPGCRASEMLLAFPVPVDPNDAAELPTQDLHAFLPVRDYGLKFILHADFVLTASRKDLDKSASWNHVLRDTIAGAFLDFVERATVGPFRYYWFRYIPSANIPKYFLPIHEEVLRELSKRPVFESFDGKMTIPSNLVYVDPLYTDDRGTPLTLNSSTASRYLSDQYHESDIPRLLKLGVGVLQPIQFLKDLAVMLKSDCLGFQKKPENWHNRLAGVLVRMWFNAKLRPAISALALIPLMNGSWTSNLRKSVFFPIKTEGLRAPDGLPIRFVDSHAARSINRRALFHQLGVQDCDTLSLCQSIAKMHVLPDFKPHSVPRAHLISQARFLYHTQYVPQGPGLWFATKKDGRSHNSEIYTRMDCAKDSPLSKVYSQLETKFDFLHDDYWNVPATDREPWSSWLMKTCKIPRVPRLVTDERQAAPTLSPEFRFLFDSCDSRDVLWVLKENWSHYSHWLDDHGHQQVEGRPSFESTDKLRGQLGSQLIQCQTGRKPISHTVLGNVDAVMEHLANLPIVDLYEARNPHWKILGCLGVAVERNAEYYIRCLESVRDCPQPRTLSHTYEQLKECYAREADFIRTMFIKRSLIYVPAKTLPSSGTLWHTVPECIVKDMTPLKEYPDCTFFFRSLLMKDMNKLDSLTEKLGFLDSSSTLSDISQLFRDLSNAIREQIRTTAYHLPRKLRIRRIFPVTRNEGDSSFDYLASIEEQVVSWFIADRTHLQNSFRGKIPLLAFRPDELEEMEILLKLFKVENRKLSSLVKTETSPQGHVHHDDSYTSFIRERAVFLQALVPKSHPTRARVLSQLDNIQVNTVADVVRKYSLFYDQRKVIGRPESAEVASILAEEVLSIFMTEECISAETPSFELLELCASHCGIRLPLHKALLSIALTERSLSRIRNTFHRQGVHVDLVLDDTRLLKPDAYAKRYAGASGDVPTMQSAFNNRGLKMEGTVSNDQGRTENDYQRADGIRLTTTDNLGQPDQRSLSTTTKRKDQPDTVLPFNVIKVAGSLASADLGPTQTFTNQSSSIEQYLGEFMMSQFFHDRLGSLYNPDVHWTSIYREGAGYDHFHESMDTAKFTFSEQTVSSAITDLLALEKFADVVSGQISTPVYHFDVAVTPRDRDSSFPMSVSQLERMRQYRYDHGGSSPNHVSILVRLRHIYQGLKYEFYVNPWSFYMRGGITLQGSLGIEASFRDLCVKWPALTPCSADRNDVSKKMSGSNGTPVEEAWAASGPLIVSSHTTHAREADLKGNTRLCNHEQCGPLRMGTAIVGVPEPGKFQRYTYRKARTGDIRLLQLMPGLPGEALRGVIVHVPFDTPGSYRALSYVWGTMSQSERLWTPTGVVSITPNLKAALEQLRHKDTILSLWVDAICIHQADSAEKARQIRMMPAIFQRATSMFAYLGRDVQSVRAMETLMQIRAKEALDEWPAILPPVPESWDGKDTPPLDDPVWDDIWTFYQNPWFGRAWIVQEVVHAVSVRVVCGTWVVDWNDLLLATHRVHHEYEKRTASGHLMTDVRPWEYLLELAEPREWEARQMRWALINLLERFRYLSSTVTRDRLFALLCISSDGFNAGLEVDYDSPLESIVTRYAGVFIGQGKVLQMLYRAGLGSQPSRFPSWVPDWTVLKPESLYEASKRGKTFAASWVPEPTVEHDVGSDEIAISGYRLDAVVKVTMATNVPQEWFQLFEELDKMPTRARWKIPIAGIEYPKTLQSGGTSLAESFKFFYWALLVGKGREIVDWDKGLNYAQALQDNLVGWRAFETRGGYVGMGPPSVEVEDIVSVFDGGGVPFVIRESKEKDDAFRLIGECYVEEHMYGEQWRADWLNESFRLH